jgi:CBS domain containing-hemolysin-like protein
LSGIILKIFRVDISKKQTTFTENELRTIMDVSHEEGVIEAEEKKMINNVFDFGETQAKDIMVPRIDMCMIDIDSSYEDIMDIFKKDRYTRIPVCDGDDVVGILNIKDLLLYQPGNTFNIKDYLRPAFFTYEYKNLSELMIEIKKCSVNIIIVLDEYGVTAGLLTFEDILEEIVGDIRDEYDYDEEDIIEKVHDNEYLIDAQISLDDLNDKISLDLSSEAYDTLGGFIIEHLDRLAKEGDKVEYENLLLLVEKMDKKRIDTVRLLIKEEVAE